MWLEIRDPLREENWQEVEKAALRILEKTGMLVGHAEVLSALAGRGGVHVAGQIVRLEPKLVREHLGAFRGTTDYDTHMISGAYSHQYLDPETNETRRPTLNDLIKSVRQANALGEGVCAPVVPFDVPGPRQELVMERITHENARLSYGGGQATTAAAAEASMEMSAVVHRPHELELWVNSPLNMDPTGLDILQKLRSRRPRVRVTNMPVRGLSAPISLAAILAQTVAECLGAATILHLAGIAGAISFRIDAFWGYAIDMRSTNVLICGPDYLRLAMLSIFLGRRYGVEKPMAKALLTSSKLPDEQAAAEKAAQALAVALAGADTFLAAGTLAGVETFSPVQMIVDHEIMRWLDAFCRPLDFSADDFLLSVIDEVGPGGLFTDHISTVQRYRDVFWKPKLFSLNSYPAWEAEGRPQLLERARDLLNALKLPDEPIVSQEQQRELARIEERLAATL